MNRQDRMGLAGRTLAGCFTSAVLVASMATATPAQTVFRGNAARTGVYETEGPREFTGLEWVFETAGPIVASPVLADGVVYVASLDGHLYAVDQKAGTEKWRSKSRMPIASSAAIDGELLYFVSSIGALAALDRETGEIRWTFATEYERKFEAKNLHGYPSTAQTIPDSWDIFVSSPAVVEGKVYFGSGDGGVYAVDAATGVLQWKFSTGNVVHASPAVVGGVVYVGSFDGFFYALDAQTGARKWVFEGGHDPVIHNQEGFQSSPAVVDGVVYVGCRDAHVYALDAGSGRKLWDHPTSKSWVVGSPAVRDGVVYVGTSDSARFMALDAATGHLRFHFDGKGFLFSSPALAGDLAYLGSFTGKLYAVDITRGELAWEFQTEASRIDAADLLDDQGAWNPTLFAPLFGDYQDMVVAFSRLISIGAIVSSPAVADGKVYVGSLDGNLYAIR